MNPRFFPFRLLPLTMAAIALVMVVKVIDLVRGGRELSDALLVGTVEAAASSEGGEDEKTAEEMIQKFTTDRPDNLLEEAEPEFSKTEIELLKSLSRRRETLEEREKELQTRENLLLAVEEKLKRQSTELGTLKQEVQALLALYEKKESEKVQRLVKMYESMKPKDAAQIFERLDMEVLLPVVVMMKEKKAALIMAKMPAEKAKQITVHLSQYRKLKGRERGGEV